MKTLTAAGIDVSKYQGDVDFAAVKRAGYDFVIIRAGYGRYASQKDPLFESHYAKAKKAGLGIGTYWYSYATSAKEAAEEAKACLEVIRDKQFDYPVFFDLETPAAFAMGKTVCSDMVKSFCNALESAGYFAGLYISRSPLETYITADVAKRYALWIAEYADACSYDGAYGMWQRSSTGNVDGVNGDVDLNACYVDYPAIIRGGGFNGYPRSSQTSAPSSPEPSLRFSAGEKIVLRDAVLYASATAVSGSKKSGTFYLYDDAVVRGRMRITNAKEHVGKTPIGVYVTGWVRQIDMLPG